MILQLPNPHPKITRLFAPAYHQNGTGETDGGIHAANRWNALRLLRRRVTQALASVEGVVVNEVRVGAARLTSSQNPRPSILPLPPWPKPASRRIWKRDHPMPTPATESLTLPVLGMTCASCQHHVEAALRSTAGVESARVDLMAHRASVVFDPAIATPAQLVEAIRAAGYDAVLPRADASAAKPPSDALARWSRTQGLCHADRRRRGHAAGHAARNAEMGALDHALMRLFPGSLRCRRICCAGFC